MTAIKQNSELYDKIFKNVALPDTFQSRFPSYEVIANGFLDPSTEGLLLQRDKLNGDQTGDIRNYSRLLLKDLAVTMGDSSPVNFPSMLLDGLFNVIQSLEVKTALTDYDVTDKIMTNVTSPGFNKVGGVPGLVIGTGLLTLSLTVPIVGMIASAIVGIAKGISDKIKNDKQHKLLDEKNNRSMLYKTFAPLQVAGSGSDGDLAELMRGTFQSHDWTDIWSPRFTGDSWVGIERQGGFAFAPGEITTDASEFAADVGEKFTPSGGFGIVPGTDIVTSVIQVSLPHDPSDPLSESFQRYMTKKGPNNTYGPDPRTFKNAWSMVTDVGTYYPTSGKIGASWWAIALKEGNWYKFRIDSLRLHKEWQNYCESGLRFIRQKCYKWTQGNLNGDYEGYFGTAIYYAIGAWAGRVNGGTNAYPTYEKLAKPIGYTRDQMVESNLYKNGLSVNSINSGAFLPLAAITDAKGNFYKNSWWCDSCLGSIYERGYEIKTKLDDLRNRQKWDLYRTLGSAYCSQFDAAFQGDKNGLLKLLLDQRKLLLSHSDRKKIILDDVLIDEPGLQGIKNSQNWRQQLIDAGVPLVQPKNSNFNKFDMKVNFGSNTPPDLNPPGEVNIDAGPANPYGRPIRKGRSSKSKVSSSSNMPILLAGAGAVGYFFLSK